MFPRFNNIDALLTNKSLFTFENKIKSKKIHGCFRPKTLFHYFITYHHNFVFRLKLLKWQNTKPIVITKIFGGVEIFFQAKSTPIPTWSPC